MKILFVLLTWLIPSYQALAHDPGLSTISLRVVNDDIQFTVTLARDDVRYWLRGDAALPTSELVSRLQRQVVSHQAFTLVKSDEQRAPSHVTVTALDESAIQISGLFVDVNHVADWKVVSRSLNELPRGHRQRVIWHESSGRGELVSLLTLDAPITPSLGSTEPVAWFNVFWQYLPLGMWHIWRGYDHLLFLLLLLAPIVFTRQSAIHGGRAVLLRVVSAVSLFSVTHSIALAMTLLGVVAVSPVIVETAILLTLVYAAISNWRGATLSHSYWMATVFGLIHGMGFAGYLRSLTSSTLAGEVSIWSTLLTLMGFNLGVEVGQIAIVLITLPVLLAVRRLPVSRRWFIPGTSTAVTAFALASLPSVLLF